MQIIVSGRRSGKTTKLIKLCAEKGGLIVCANVQRVESIAKMAREMGLKIPQPITFDELRERQYYGTGVKQFYIDDAEYLLQYLTPVPIVAITMSKEDPPEGRRFYDPYYDGTLVDRAKEAYRRQERREETLKEINEIIKKTEENNAKRTD